MKKMDAETLLHESIKGGLSRRADSASSLLRLLLNSCTDELSENICAIARKVLLSHPADHTANMASIFVILVFSKSSRVLVGLASDRNVPFCNVLKRWLLYVVNGYMPRGNQYKSETAVCFTRRLVFAVLNISTAFTYFVSSSRPAR